MIRHLVLLGAGPGHLHFLQSLLKKRSNELAITLITRQERCISDAQLLRAVAGHAPMQTCGVELEPLLRKVNVNWLDHSVQAIKPEAKLLVLDDGRELRFDWLSLEPEPLHNRELTEAQMPGARGNGLFLRPREAFCKLWPRVAELAAQKPQRFAVIFGGVPPLGAKTPVPDAQNPALLDWTQEKFAIELAFAVRRAFNSSAVTLITGGQGVAAGASPAMRAHVQDALKRQRITVLADAASSVQAGELSLQSGARLACDVPLLALQTQPPPFVASSNLALGEAGQIDVDRAQCSSSHPFVFATGPSFGAALAASLQSLMAGKAPPGLRQKLPEAPQLPWQTLRCTERHVIVAWRQWAWTIRWPGRQAVSAA